MSLQLRVPDSLRRQLRDYRRRVAWVKTAEAVATIAAVWAAALLIVYAADRWIDTPAAVRGLLWTVAVVLLGLIPWAVSRWIVSLQGLRPVAKLLGENLPAVGDRLLGVIELVDAEGEQARSPALCQAAMDQVAADAAGRDFSTATPPHRLRAWAIAASVLGLAAGGLAMAYPAATATAAWRTAAPWSATPRYTFTRIERLGREVVLPHGETAAMTVRLTDQTLQKPAVATLWIDGQTPLKTLRQDDRYAFDVPPLLADQTAQIRVGDWWHDVTLRPTMRPELAAVTASVRLPDYLGRDQPQEIDSRSGRVAIVRGSEAVVSATADRDLATGQINAVPARPSGATLTSAPVRTDDTATLAFDWTDRDGLSGRQPFEITVEAIDDQPPTLIVDGLERMAVVLDTQTLTFTIDASDDHGVARVGLMWRGVGAGAVSPAKGERTLAAGSHKSTQLPAAATFNAASLGVEPQPIELFAWAEDYLPGRGRVFSPPHVLYVLTPDQHAIWMTEQLSRWHRQALDVRDRERQLHQTNRELRELDPAARGDAEVQRQIARQAAAENANGTRLARLGELGDDLLVAARRNPAIGVGHLERWADMMQLLDDLSQNRMPSVADLLDDASRETTQQLAAAQSSQGGPSAGQNRRSPSGSASEPSPEPTPTRAAPSLTDAESSLAGPDDQPAAPGTPKKPSSPALRMPVTTIAGQSKPKPPAEAKPPAAGALPKAVTEQEDLLAEFDKIADELNAVLANLEGSTLVKRLKAASRTQNVVAGRLTEQLQPAFGVAGYEIPKAAGVVFDEIKTVEADSSQDVSYIMDDLASYFERRRFANFKTTLDEMKDADAVGSLRNLSDQVSHQQGLSVAQAEYWADAMDRWADNLVDPACSGQCPGGCSPESLPPSIVLEALQILEGEIALRDQTRVADQARHAITADDHYQTTVGLSTQQSDLDRRVVALIERIGELPDAAKHFGKELRMLTQVDAVMAEIVDMLEKHQTDSPTIAAQTEVIELMLRSKRINPNGGGGGGSSPGGGSGGGNTVDSALALVGRSRDAKATAQSRSVTQTTGSSGTEYPEEFRHGLDQYFSGF